MITVRAHLVHPYRILANGPRRTGSPGRVSHGRLAGTAAGVAWRGVWDIANETSWCERGPDEDECVRLLGQFACRRALVADVSPGQSAELSGVISRHKRIGDQTEGFGSPLRCAVPIWDPDRFLTANLAVCAAVF